MAWTRRRVDEMCDWIADGFSLADTARLMHATLADVRREFDKVKAALGAQAR